MSAHAGKMAVKKTVKKTVRADPRFAFPRVGIAVVVVRKGLILLGQRKGGYASGEWAFPGGKLELQESWVECAHREVQEETGLRVQIAKEPISMSNDIWSGQRHYVTIYMAARSAQGEAKVTEPDKCVSWAWFRPNTLPEPMFLPLRNFLKEDPGLKRTIRIANAISI